MKLTPYQASIARVLFTQYKEGIEEKKQEIVTNFEGLVDADELEYQIEQCNDFLSQLPPKDEIIYS